MEEEKTVNQEKKASFVIQIKYRKHYTWQGTVKWLETNEEMPFRSALELIKLMDSITEECNI